MVDQCRNIYLKAWMTLTVHTACYCCVVTRQLGATTHLFPWHIVTVVAVAWAVLSWRYLRTWNLEQLNVESLIVPAGATARDLRHYALLLLSLGSVQWVMSLTQSSAHAGFLDFAETTLKQCFPGADSAISIVFATARFIFIIYLGFSLLRSFNAARDGEDWLSLAKTPALTVAMVVIGDILSRLILSGTTC